MRLVSALLFVALTGSTTLAEEAKPADPKPEVSKRRVPLRVVRMLPETQQVLLFDKNRGTHVVAEVGQNVDGYVVDDIDEDEVTLISETGAEVILAAPDATWRRRAFDRKAPGKAGKAVAAVEPHPVDPYGDAAAADATAGSTVPATTGATPATGATAGATGATGAMPGATGATPGATGATPGATSATASSAATGASTAAATGAASGLTAGEGGMRVASATDTAPTAVPVDSTQPADPYANVDPGIAAFVDAVGAVPAPATTAPAEPTAASAAAKAKAAKQTDAAGALAAAATGSPAPAATSAAVSAAPSSAATAKAPAAPANAFTISRGEVDAALADFGATAVTFDARFVADGLRIDSIAEGTILAKLGLRKGDVLTAVDNQSVRGFDDAATLYARAGTARGATLSILRAGKPQTLRVTIR